MMDREKKNNWKLLFYLLYQIPLNRNIETFSNGQMEMRLIDGVLFFHIYSFIYFSFGTRDSCGHYNKIPFHLNVVCLGVFFANSTLFKIDSGTNKRKE